MSELYYRTKNRPKIIGAIEQSIFNDAPPPDELLKFHYRKTFGLSALQLAEEPSDELFTNLHIIAQIREKERLNNQHG